MSDILAAAVKTLNEKLDGNGISGSIRIEIEDEGALRVDKDGASLDDSEADCTLTADADTFLGMLAGDVDPTTAFMSGRLKIDGDMGIAMQLGSALA